MENSDGIKSVVKSVNGSYITVPQGFEGTLSMPLDAEYLVNPDWWLQEDHDYKNGVLDLERVFMVSFFMPARTDGITFEDPETWSVFEVDNAIFCSDDSVEKFIEENGGSADEAVKSVVKAKEGSGFEVDYGQLTITIAEGTTKNVFTEGFDLGESVNITVKDTYGFVVSESNSVLESDMIAEFTKGIDKYTFRIVVAKEVEKGDDAKRNGCNSEIGTSAIIVGGYAVFAAGALLLLRRRTNREE